MTDDDLDAVRAVLDYMPAERYDDLPADQRRILSSLDRRLNRTVAVKTKEEVQVVVERAGEGAEKVRAFLDDRAEPPERDVVLEPVEAAEPEEAEPIPTPTAGEGPTELTLDEPPQPETREPIETEAWPDVEPETDEPEPPADEEAWPEVEPDRPEPGSLGGFEPVDDQDEGDAFEPDDEETGWPEVPGESAAEGGADEPGERSAWPEPDEPEEDELGVWEVDEDDEDEVPDWPDPDEDDEEL